MQNIFNTVRKPGLLVFALLNIWLFGGFVAPPIDNRILGLWQSAENDLRVEVYLQNGQYNARIAWFLCEGNDPPIADHYDTKNPDPALRHRPWLGLNTLEKLTYGGNNEWSGGKVYDPNSGNTFDATVRLVSANQITVRGYWKLSFLGKTLIFNRFDAASGHVLVRNR
jgi:uncharacterized protein (DUF2147 family)